MIVPGEPGVIYSCPCVDPHGSWTRAPTGIKGPSQERLGRWPAVGQEPEWNMGTLGHIRKPLVKGQERALGAVPKYLSR